MKKKKKCTYSVIFNTFFVIVIFFPPTHSFLSTLVIEIFLTSYLYNHYSPIYSIIHESILKFLFLKNVQLIS